MSPSIPARWNALWVWMWVAISGFLLTTAFIIPPKQWSILTVILFGVPELIGILHKRDRFPPLTYVCRRYLPRWLTVTAIFTYAGALGAYWFGFAGREWKLAAFFGLVGWLQDHFDLAYSEPGE